MTGSDAELVWIDEAFLLERDVQPWNELPLWAPDRPQFAGVWAVDSSAAVRTGLACRPVSESLRDTWAWLRGGGAASPMAHRDFPDSGIEPDKERTILDAWLAG